MSLLAEQEAEAEIEQTYEEIDKLQDLGINATEIKRLKENGFYTIQSLFMCRKAVSKRFIERAVKEPHQSIRSLSHTSFPLFV